MKIALFGAGMIGSRVAAEALDRGHEVTVVSRDPSKILTGESGAKAPAKVAANILEPAQVAQVVAGHDAVVSAVGPRRDPPEDAQMLIDAARSLHEGLIQAGVKRLIIVGGAASLEVAPGKLLLDTPEFPEAWKPAARAAFEGLKLYRTMNDLDWTYLSPAGFIEPGKRTGVYRTDLERLVVDASGKSHISAEDYAVALVDELERPKHVRQRFTVAY